jgi:hypothetical protein
MKLINRSRRLPLASVLIVVALCSRAPAVLAQSGSVAYDSLTVIVRPGVAPFMLRFLKPGSEGSEAGLRIEVSQAGAVRQSLALEDLSQGGCSQAPSNCVKVRDINFDGYADLQIFRNTAGQSRDWTFLRYDPKKNAFITDDVLNGASGNVALDSAKKSLVFTWIGEAGHEYGVSEYQWRKDRFVEVREVTNVRQPDNEHAIQTVRELRRGAMVVVSTETVVADDLED